MRNKTLCAAIVLGLSVSAAMAAVPAAQAPDGSGERRSRPTLDADGDGAIDRQEAARSPRLAAAFDRLDADRDGRLDRKELRAAHDRHGHGHGQRRAGRGAHGHGMSGHGVHGWGGHGSIDAVARLDADGDGRLSRAELEAAVPAGGRRDARGAERQADVPPAERGDRRAAQDRPRPGRGPVRSPLLAHFDAIDSDGDGHIVRAELRAWHAARRAAHAEARDQRFEERFKAADADGDGRLNRQEVEQGLPRFAAAFAWLDENRDGFLDRAELRPGSR